MSQLHFEETFGHFIIPEKVRAEEEKEGYPYLQCPYCLFGSYALNDFIILNKNGKISKKMALCSSCHNTLRRSTLVSTGKLDWKHYASYLASLSMYDSDHRIKWEKIFLALKQGDRAFVTEFWKNYREEKARIDPNYAIRKAYAEYEKAENAKA